MAEHTIAAIYTGAALVKPLSDLMKEILGDYKVMNILDDSMIADIIEAGGMTKAVKRRLYGYYEIACASGAELILNTCSSIGMLSMVHGSSFPSRLLELMNPWLGGQLNSLTQSLSWQHSLPPWIQPYGCCKGVHRRQGNQSRPSVHWLMVHSLPSPPGMQKPMID